jgi:alanyl aminopeptidase
VRDRPLQVRGIAPKGRGAQLSTALDASAGLLPRLEEWFGIPFPYPKLDHVRGARLPLGGMENAGLIVYTDTYLLADARHASRDERLTIAWVMAHEMAHQWFGDLVTMRFWDDKWLNESFATFMQAEVVVPWKPALHYELDRLEGTHEAMANDELETARPIRQPIHSENEIAGTDDSVLYPKGSAVLGMFSARLGRDRFRGAIRDYLTEHSDGNAATDDLLATLDRIDPSVGPSFRTFIDQPGLPGSRPSSPALGARPSSPCGRNARFRRGHGPGRISCGRCRCVRASRAVTLRSAPPSTVPPRPSPSPAAAPGGCTPTPARPATTAGSSRRPG